MTILIEDVPRTLRSPEVIALRRQMLTEPHMAPLARYVDSLKDLLVLLPKVKTVVLVGRKAGRAQKLLEGMNLRIFTSAHPSPKVRSINRPMWDLIPRQWAQAGSYSHAD
ncbi:hypothetical protein [Paraburkholderia fungorum]|jgi:hypothetical protein|uniref:hypothetical protein n=1 Tax=Paraburkholderia fungorum TaxID=134537 RepID=UPI001FCA348E|nr:hypothetical protein [Paraburkholderia fungorum]